MSDSGRGDAAADPATARAAAAQLPPDGDAGYLVPTRRGADLLAVSLMFVFITGAVTLSLLPVITNELRVDLQMTDAQIGLLTSVFMGFYGLSAILSGIAAARWGGWLLGVSCGCFVVGSLIFALSASFGGFAVGRAIQGIAGGMVIATSSPVLAHALPPRLLGRAWGILGAGWGLGTMASLLVMPSIQALGGYRAVFLTDAALGFVVGVAVMSQKAVRTRPRYAEGVMDIRALARSFWGAVSNRRVMILAFVNTAVLAMSVGVLAWTPSFLQDIHGSPEALSVYLLAGLGAAQVIGNPLGAVGMARWGKLPVIVASMLVTVVVTALVGLVPGVPLAVAFVLVCGLASMYSFPAMLAYLPEVVRRPDQVGPAAGLNGFMGFAGSLVAPWLFGLFLDAGGQSRGSYNAGYLMLAAFGVASLVTLIFFRTGERAARRENASR